nr:phospholipase-like protein [Tanacetum cinerariifolium]
MIDNEIIMSEQEESNHEYAQSTHHLEDEDDVDEWLNAKIKKHMSMQKLKSKKDALIGIIKSIRQEMRDGIKKRQLGASTINVSDTVSSIASNDKDNKDNNTLNTTPCLLPKELSPGSFLLPFNIKNHNFYAATTLDAKDNIMPQRVYEYLGLDKLRGLVGLSPDRKGLVKRWHVCKPIHVTYNYGSGKDCGMWPTCDPDSKLCFGYDEDFGVDKHGTLMQWICFRDHERRIVKGSYIGFADFLQVRYGQQKSMIQHVNEGHNNLHESNHEFIFNEWILDSYDVEEEYAKEIGNRYSKRFDEYNSVQNEIDQLSNEYILRIGKKGYVLDDVWEKCEQYYKKTNEAWYDEGYEEDEMWRIRDEKTDYDPPYVNIKTFEVKRYSFKGGRSFVCITDHEDDSLPLGRVNRARFKAMIRKEMKGSKYIHKEL